MTDVFFIAYEFPPLNRGGVFRPLKFVKYFNNFDIKPIIFTLNPNDFEKVYLGNTVKDESLINEIKNVEKEVIFVNSEDIINQRKNKLISFYQIYFQILGVTHKKWKKNFFTEAKKALKKYNPKVIVVTAPPFGMVELAYKLSKKTGIPLVIDMRDSFSMWIAQPFGSYFHFRATLKKERKWFNHAEKVIAVTKQMINDWKSVHKNIQSNKFKVIPNGYDENIDFSDLILKPNEKITIGYIGSFYYNPESHDLMFKPWHKKKLHRKLQYVPRKEDWLYRTPYFLFKTLNILFKKNPDLKNIVSIKFAGTKPGWLESMVTDFDLKENVEHLGFLNHKEINKFQSSCNLMLATSVKVIGAEDYCIAGKTFDYIMMKKIILGFVTDGAQKQFIEKSGTGIICNPDDIENSANTLKQIFENGITLKPNKDFIKTHHRKNLTKQLANIIHSI